MEHIIIFTIVGLVGYGEWMRWKAEGKLPPARIGGIGRIVEVRG